MNQEKEADDFHDSDAGDLYDLYIAVNGDRHNGLLDIRKLDELTEEESKILNAPRLREIWEHTATGCIKCKQIIMALDTIRNVLREEANEETAAPIPILDQFDSIEWSS